MAALRFVILKSYSRSARKGSPKELVEEELVEWNKDRLLAELKKNLALEMKAKEKPFLRQKTWTAAEVEKLLENALTRMIVDFKDETVRV